MVLSVPLHVCFFVIVPRTLVIDVLTLHLTTFIFPVMSASMNMCFHLIILNILQRSRAQPAPNLPLSPSRLYSTTHHYPLQTATLPQPPPLPCSSSHACLSNHYDAGSARQLVLSIHPNASLLGFGAIYNPSSASPLLASIIIPPNSAIQY